LTNLDVYEGILRELGREAEADSIRDMKLELTAAANTVGG
jgi:hypothetical protein